MYLLNITLTTQINPSLEPVNTVYATDQLSGLQCTLHQGLKKRTLEV